MNVDRPKTFRKHNSAMREATQSQRVCFLLAVDQSQFGSCCCHLGVSGPVPQSSFQAGLVHSSHPVVNLADCTIILSAIFSHGLKDLMGTLDRCPTEVKIPYIYISLRHQSGNLINKVYNKLLFKDKVNNNL